MTDLDIMFLELMVYYPYINLFFYLIMLNMK